MTSFGPRDSSRDVLAGLGLDDRVFAAAEHQGRNVDARYRGDLLGPAGRELALRGLGIPRAAVMADRGHRPGPVSGERITRRPERPEHFQGLIGPILIGIYSPADALALLDHQLDRIFR